MLRRARQPVKLSESVGHADRPGSELARIRVDVLVGFVGRSARVGCRQRVVLTMLQARRVRQTPSARPVLDACHLYGQAEVVVGLYDRVPVGPVGRQTVLSVSGRPLQHAHPDTRQRPGSRVLSGRAVRLVRQAAGQPRDAAVPVPGPGRGAPDPGIYESGRSFGRQAGRAQRTASHHPVRPLAMPVRRRFALVHVPVERVQRADNSETAGRAHDAGRT